MFAKRCRLRGLRSAIRSGRTMGIDRDRARRARPQRIPNPGGGSKRGLHVMRGRGKNASREREAAIRIRSMTLILAELSRRSSGATQGSLLDDLPSGLRKRWKVLQRGARRSDRSSETSVLGATPSRPIRRHGHIFVPVRRRQDPSAHHRSDSSAGL